MKLVLSYPPGVNTLYGVRTTISREKLVPLLAAVRAGKLELHEAATQIQKLAVAFPYKTREHSDYAAAAKASVKRLSAEEWPRPAQISMDVKLYRPRRAGDIDGPLKTLLDVCQGLIYENDDQISRLVVERFDDKDNPRVEVDAERRIVAGEQDEMPLPSSSRPDPDAENARRAGVVSSRPILTTRELAAKAKSAVISFRTQNEPKE